MPCFSQPMQKQCNIDTNTGISSIRLFLNNNRRKIPSNFPTDLFLEVLSIVMRNNIFSFSNTYWLQLTGTAMGTPTACSYATVAYGQHENSTILTTFHPYLLYYRWYINGISTIFLVSGCHLQQEIMQSGNTSKQP